MKLPSQRSNKRLNTSITSEVLKWNMFLNQIRLRNHVTTERAPRTVVPPKTKIFSILDRARVAMEESYKTSSEPSYHEHHA